MSHDWSYPIFRDKDGCCIEPGDGAPFSRSIVEALNASSPPNCVPNENQLRILRKAAAAVLWLRSEPHPDYDGYCVPVTVEVDDFTEVAL